MLPLHLAGLRRGLASIIMLNRIVDFLRKCGVTVGTVSSRSQQPGPDRFQDLLQRQTRRFFCLKVDGQDEQVCERAQGKVMMKATPGIFPQSARVPDHLWNAGNIVQRANAND